MVQGPECNMAFTTVDFALFFFIVLVLHRTLPKSWLKSLLLLASYVFYAWWDWRFLPLILVSTTVDFLVAPRIAPVDEQASSEHDRKRRFWLVGDLVIQLALLGFFKYSDFLLSTVASIASVLGIDLGQPRLDLILPLGISFYTFKTMTYTIDVYRGHLKPTRNIFDYALHVSFFPTLIAGPIERARNFLPQLIEIRRASAEQVVEGAHLIFWGLFKKVFVADNIAILVNQIFSAPEHSGFGVMIGAYAFAIQLFCDFSGYTDIARGCAKCLGLELSENFRQPYLATSPSDFWQRWHITLSTWLRDYIFLPLGGAFKSLPNAYRNLAITMVLAGLWHGASWTFVLWGCWWAILLVGHRILQPVMKSNGAWFRRVLSKNARKFFKILVTVQLVCLGWILFRAGSLSQFWAMITALFEWKGTADWSLFMPLVKFGGLYLAVELVLISSKIESLYRLRWAPVTARTALYAVLFYFLAFYGSGSGTFIYAQF